MHYKIQMHAVSIVQSYRILDHLPTVLNHFDFVNIHIYLAVKRSNIRIGNLQGEIDIRKDNKPNLIEQDSVPN